MGETFDIEVLDLGPVTYSFRAVIFGRAESSSTRRRFIAAIAVADSEEGSESNFNHKRMSAWYVGG